MRIKFDLDLDLDLQEKFYARKSKITTLIDEDEANNIIAEINNFIEEINSQDNKESHVNSALLNLINKANQLLLTPSSHVKNIVNAFLSKNPEIRIKKDSLLEYVQDFFHEYLINNFLFKKIYHFIKNKNFSSDDVKNFTQNTFEEVKKVSYHLVIYEDLFINYLRSYYFAAGRFVSVEQIYKESYQDQSVSEESLLELAHYEYIGMQDEQTESEELDKKDLYEMIDKLPLSHEKINNIKVKTQEFHKKNQHRINILQTFIKIVRSSDWGFMPNFDLSDLAHKLFENVKNYYKSEKYSGAKEGVYKTDKYVLNTRYNDLLDIYRSSLDYLENTWLSRYGEVNFDSCFLGLASYHKPIFITLWKKYKETNDVKYKKLMVYVYSLFPVLDLLFVRNVLFKISYYTREEIERFEQDSTISIHDKIKEKIEQANYDFVEFLQNNIEIFSYLEKSLFRYINGVLSGYFDGKSKNIELIYNMIVSYIDYINYLSDFSHLYFSDEKAIKVFIENSLSYFTVSKSKEAEKCYRQDYHIDMSKSYLDLKYFSAVIKRITSELLEIANGALKYVYGDLLDKFLYENREISKSIPVFNDTSNECSNLKEYFDEYIAITAFLNKDLEPNIIRMGYYMFYINKLKGKYTYNYKNAKSKNCDMVFSKTINIYDINYFLHGKPFYRREDLSEINYT
ncbi:MAG: hypothetical protein QXF12_01905 [Candidatus Aenigmatarchaeota archaeon]